MREVLTIDVDVTGTTKVHGATEEAELLAFTGTVNCDNFVGKILDGGIDHQRERYGSPRTLSARYILEGKDLAGQDCRIFIENNGTAEADGFVKQTTPTIITDSKALAYLETAKLVGTITPRGMGITIHIFVEEEQ